MLCNSVLRIVHVMFSMIAICFSLGCRLVCADISKGLEEIPVPASNVVDAIPVGPGKVNFLCPSNFSSWKMFI